jgi:hypothetical protein
LSLFANWIHPTFGLRKSHPITHTFNASNIIHEMTKFSRTGISVLGNHSASIELDVVGQQFLSTLRIGNASSQISRIGNRTRIFAGGARAKCRCTLLLGSFLDAFWKREFFIIVNINIIILPLLVSRKPLIFCEGTHTCSWNSCSPSTLPNSPIGLLLFVRVARGSGGGSPLFRRRFFGAAVLGGIFAEAGDVRG